MSKVFCMGIKCPVKNTCLRYTKGLMATMYDGTEERYIRRCTNQKKYMQDGETINKDSKRV
jgi:hypothetical protein